MDELKTWWAFIAACAAVVGPPASAFSYAVWNIMKRLATLEANDALQDRMDAAQEFKLKIIWEWFMRGAIEEGVTKGVLAKNSPIVATESVRPFFEPVKEKLHEFYRTSGYLMQEYELEIAIVSLLGVEYLERNICLPLGLERGACVKAAAAIAKEEWAEAAKQHDRPSDPMSGEATQHD